MAISTSAGATGITVRSAAKDSRRAESTLGSQTAAAADEVIVPNVIGTNNEGNLESSPTYVGRLIAIRHRQHDEEIRYITADVSNTLTVHEPWEKAPVSGDEWALAYIIEDLATVNGMTLLSKRTRDYGMSRVLTVGNNQDSGDQRADFAWFALLDSASLELEDNDSATVPSFDLVNGGYFSNGYLSSGKGVAGGYLIHVTTADALTIQSIMGKTRLVDFFMTGVEPTANWISPSGDIQIRRAKMFSSLQTMTFLNNGAKSVFSLLEDVLIEGRGSSFDNLSLDDSVVIDGLTVSSINQIFANGLNTLGIMRWRNVTVLPAPSTAFLMEVDFDVRVQMVNPLWSVNDLTLENVSDTNTMDFPDSIGGSGQCQEIFEVALKVVEPDGTGIELSSVFVTEEHFGDGVQSSTVSAEEGEVTLDVTKRIYNREDGTTVDGPFTTATEGFGFLNAAPDTITRNDPGGSFLTDGYVADAPLEVLLAEDAANNAIHRIASVTATVLTLASNNALTTNSDDNAATLQGIRHVHRNLRDGFAIHTYSYGRAGGVFPLTAFHGTGGVGDLNTQPQGLDIEAQALTAALATDANIAAATIELAFSNPTTDPVWSKHGPGETDTQPIKVINYDGGTGTIPTVGEAITINNSGADTTGDLVEFIGDAVSGTLVLENWNGVEPEDDVNITGDTSSFDATSHTDGAGSYDEEFTILIDANSATMSELYDYENAVMSKPGKLSDYLPSKQVNTPMLHRTAADEWYAIVKNDRGQMQMLKSTQDFGIDKLEDYDWTPVGLPFFPLGHTEFDNILDKNREPFGMYAVLDGGDIHVMTVSAGLAVSYHIFDPGTDSWTLQNEFVSIPGDFHTAMDNGSHGGLFTGLANCNVSFQVRSDGDVVAMVPRFDDEFSSGGGNPIEAQRGHYEAMTRESGTWASQGQITTNNDPLPHAGCLVLMDTSDLATFVWTTTDLPGGVNDQLTERTLSSINVLSAIQTVDSDIITGGGFISDVYKQRIGHGVIDGTNQIWVCYVDNGTISVADWASTAGVPSVTITSPVTQTVSAGAARDLFPFLGMGLTVGVSNNISLIFADDTFDIYRDNDIDGGGAADTELLDGLTARHVFPIWDPDGTADDLYLFEEENFGYLMPLAETVAGNDFNPGHLQIGRGSTAMTNGVRLDARNLILLWGLREHAFTVKFGINGYFTERHEGNNEGVWVANRDVGTIDFFTPDDGAGATFTPPTAVTLEITVVDDAGIAIQNARVGIYSDPEGPGETELMNELTTAGGIATESFSFVSDTAVSVRVRRGSSGDDPKYVPSNSSQTITVDGLTVTITLAEDPNNNS